MYRNSYHRNYGGYSNPVPRIDFTETMRNISHEWKLDASQENEKFFAYMDEVNLLKDGTKCYVIGRKGMGKTAICKFLDEQKGGEPSCFSEKLTFKNFPFNDLYGLTNTSYTPPNQYITIWTYLVYNAVCKMMARNPQVDNAISGELKKLYEPDVKKGLDKLVKHWTAKDFEVSVLGSGLKVGGFEKLGAELSWIEKTDLLEDVILEYAGDAHYYILIDELDEDYREFYSAEEKRTYIELLTSLFKAVQKVKGVFVAAGLSIKPVIFLRTDIYNLISDSDKNKWSDYKIELRWDKNRLKKMICHRIKNSSSLDIPEEDIFDRLFAQHTIQMGDRNQNRMYVFDYITRSTHMRPRDYIRYVSSCAETAVQNGETAILARTVKNVDRQFSEYLKREILDEITPTMPEIQDVFSMLSSIRKQTFSPKEFVDEYTASGKTEQEAKNVLRQLFEFGVIGNQPSMKGVQIFKHQDPDALFNFKENVVIHRGLYKSLQIF